MQTLAQPILLVPKSNPRIVLIFFLFCLVLNYILYIFAVDFQASHNKDYSVVKTNRAGQLALFSFYSDKVIINFSKKQACFTFFITCGKENKLCQIEIVLLRFSGDL